MIFSITIYFNIQDNKDNKGKGQTFVFIIFIILQ